MDQIVANYKRFIVIRTSFEALHRWPECPFEDVSFLRDAHRHIFHVEVQVETSMDRQIEFIRFKRKVDKYIKKEFAGKNLGSLSCEAIAEVLCYRMDAKRVSVFEDNENGAIYERA